MINLTKEEKIKVILDIKNGTLKKKFIPVFTYFRWFIIVEDEKCINSVFLTENEYSELMEYINQLRGLQIYVTSIQTMQDLKSL